MRNDEYLEKAISWYEKAKHQNDPFLEFAINYMALEALLHWFEQNRYYVLYNRHNVTARLLIECLKEDHEVKKVFLEIIKDMDIMSIIEQLSREPLRKTYIGREKRWDGRINGIDDFSSIVEFVYQSRNNLFHGHKNPMIERDIFIVESANRFLTPLIESILEVYVQKGTSSEVKL